MARSPLCCSITHSEHLQPLLEQDQGESRATWQCCTLGQVLGGKLGVGDSSPGK